MLEGKTILIFSKKESKEATDAKKRLTDWLKKKKYKVLDATTSEKEIKQSDTKDVGLAVVIGGDGTFLTLVRRLEKKDQFPIMGVNLGTLGFITEVPKTEIISSVEQALKGKFQEEKRPLIQVDVSRKNKVVESGLVFNDAVLTKDAKTSMLKFDVELDRAPLTLVAADGYIVSTPTGSTAYGLSCGGSLMHPYVDALSLVPICPHSLSSRPIVIPRIVTVEIILRHFTGGAVYLVYDGQVSFEILVDDKICLAPSGTFLRLLQPPKIKWQEALRTKLKMS